MNAVINVVQNVIGKDTIQTVNARELHKYLQVGRVFAAWITGRLAKYEFVEGTDYVIRENRSVPNKDHPKSRPQRLKDYYLTLEVADTLTIHEQSKIRIRQDSIREGIALTTIEQILGVTLERQHYVGGYRIDGYDSINNVAYEIDEDHHSTKMDEDVVRQLHIQEALGCTFVRISV